ncbi:phosphatidylinositol 4-kinase gamma 4-like [Salvia miltiorrhiza]|uniref:phosphatidylinositol 4-kinase gamma 4-like n=1 Tax=Salvia miltiorrhiza TaxID=226208 RepID=UPI0025AC9D89|nr:phosphatidylinositol 4-kinase gamma 4-like [Salvia miltiorrhiza]
MSIASVALCPVYEDYWNFPGRISGQCGPWSNDSIVIYLTVGGSVIPMRVLESDSIASVKLRIQVCKGFSAKQQKLVFDGKELARNNSQVRDYGVSDGNVLHLVVRLSDLQAITVRTVCGKEFEFHVQRKRNVGYVKQQIAERGDGIFDLKDQELFCDGEELEDQRIIDDLCRSNDAVIHFLVRKSAKLRAVPVEKDFEVSIVASDVEEKVGDKGNRWRKRSQNEKLPIVAVIPRAREVPIEPLIVNPKIVLSPVIKQLIDETFNGLEKGNQPIRSSEGSGGAYFMQDSVGQKYVSVFKPVDEEPMAVNNPRGLPLSPNGEGLKKGTRVGEGALREVAAYILDHPRGGPRSSCSDEKGFSGVPPTVMVKCQHSRFHYSEGFNCASSKFGSLQMFMKNCGSCEDMGPRAFPVEEVHKICVLDIRLANADRHAGNILIQKDAEGQITLIPIDHGYCMPENFKDCTFEWLYWPQAREPFTPDEIAYINSLDAEKDIEVLKFYGWSVPDNCARVFRMSTMLLKKGAKRGLTPFAIGSIMCRETVKKESVIEKMVEEAEESVLPGTSESAFLESVSVIMDRYLDGLSP